MRKVSLYNITGQKLTEVNIREQEEVVHGIQWGGSIFIFSVEHSEYREANIVPAIVRK